MTELFPVGISSFCRVFWRNSLPLFWRSRLHQQGKEKMKQMDLKLTQAWHARAHHGPNSYANRPPSLHHLSCGLTEDLEIDIVLSNLILFACVFLRTVGRCGATHNSEGLGTSLPNSSRVRTCPVPLARTSVSEIGSQCHSRHTR